MTIIKNKKNIFSSLVKTSFVLLFKKKIIESMQKIIVKRLTAKFPKIKVKGKIIINKLINEGIPNNFKVKYIILNINISYL